MPVQFKEFASVWVSGSYRTPIEVGEIDRMQCNTTSVERSIVVERVQSIDQLLAKVRASSRRNNSQITNSRRLKYTPLRLENGRNEGTRTAFPVDEAVLFSCSVAGSCERVSDPESAAVFDRF